MIENINFLLHSFKEDNYFLGINLALKFESEFIEYYGISVDNYELLIHNIFNQGYTYGMNFNTINKLYLKRYKFESFKFLRLFTGLKELSLIDCGLNDIPTEIYNLTNLQVLNLRKNNLSKIDDVISNLNKLNSIVLDNNQFETIPKELLNLDSLNHVYIFDNKYYITYKKKEMNIFNTFSKETLNTLSVNNILKLYGKKIYHFNKEKEFVKNIY